MTQGCHAPLTLVGEHAKDGENHKVGEAEMDGHSAAPFT